MATPPWWQQEKWASETAYLQPFSDYQNWGENIVNFGRAEQLGAASRMREIPRAINELLKSAHPEKWYCWHATRHRDFMAIPALNFEQIPWLQFAWLQVWLQNAPNLQPLPIKQNRFHLNKALLQWLAKPSSLIEWHYREPAIAYTAADSLRLRNEQERLDRIRSQLKRVEPCAAYHQKMQLQNNRECDD